MIRIGRAPRTPTTLTSDDLEEIAYLFNADIVLPGARAGWAVVSLADGRRFRSWLDAPEAVKA